MSVIGELNYLPNKLVNCVHNFQSGIIRKCGQYENKMVFFSFLACKARLYVALFLSSYLLNSNTDWMELNFEHRLVEVQNSSYSVILILSLCDFLTISSYILLEKSYQFKRIHSLLFEIPSSMKLFSL